MIILSDADEGATTTRATLNAAGHYVANSRDGDDVTPGTTTGVIRLHEGVDTSFVFVANRLARDMANNLTSIPAATYFPYILINGNAQEIGAAPFVNDADIVYRYPGKIILSSAGGAQPTNARFIFPTQIKTSSGEMLRIPIVAEDGGVTVAQMDIFVSVDTTYFEAVDKDPSTAGVQPYTLGANAALSSGNIIGNMIDTTGATLELDFTYRDASGVTFLDGVEILANLHLKAKDLSGTANTTVTLDNNPGTNRQTSLYLTAAAGGTRISTTIPGPSAARIDPRGSIAGTVPLQGRADWTMPAAEVAFFLRKSSIRGATAVGTAGQAGGFETLDDSVFEAANDSTSNLGGVNVSIPSSGAFTLSSVPAGDYTLVVFVDRYLAGQREVTVEAGEAVTGVQPTVNGLGQDQGQLLAGDAAGYDHDGLAATNTRPDNFIDSSDESAITAAFGAETGDSLYDAYPFADVNGSGEVDGVDLNFSTVNTTTINGTNDPVKPTFNLKPAALEGSNKDAEFVLAELPPLARAGQTFDVEVQVKGAVDARAYEFHLGYNPSNLRPQGLVARGDLLAGYGVALAERDFGDEFGVATAARGIIPGVSGDGSLATIRFQAIQNGPVNISIIDGFLIDTNLKVEKPFMDGADPNAGLRPMRFHDASGEEFLGIIVPDSDPKVDFNDFFAFANAFGSGKDNENFNPLADLNQDGTVDFNDFFIIADNFGKVAVDHPAYQRATKPAADQVRGTLSLNALEAVKPGEQVTLNAVLTDAEATGVGFAVNYDPARFEFVEAAGTGDAPLFLAQPDGEGRIVVARAAQTTVEGPVASLVFQAIGEFDEPGRFEIADGLILGADGIISRVTPGSALELATLPTEFALLQNFPNPFNPETTIKYNLADPAQTQLRVYNLVGQVVRTLVREKQAAGRYTIRWDGRDDRGLTVSSGVYFYQITAGKFRDVRKLMLLK